MKVIEKIKRLFKPKAQPVSENAIPVSALPCPNKYGEPSRVDMIIRVCLYTENGNEQVRMSINGLDGINVCLASFLTKGFSYAQEKYNEYKTKGKEVEEPKEEPKVEEKKNTRKSQKGGRR